VYKITFDVPDKGLLQEVPLGDDRDDTSIPAIAPMTKPTMRLRATPQTFDVIRHELAGVWSAINLTTHTHHEQHFCNSEWCERTGVH